VVLNDLQRELREFAFQRDWQRFHTPKNLVMALTGEVGELVEFFRWLTPAAAMTRPEAERVREEVADIFAYLPQLADALDIDLATALREKVRGNEQRYPVSLARRRADKYDRLRAGDTPLRTCSPAPADRRRHTISPY
jgi:NTP pyrophosphatase (non-canonical NTP hydrolase)